MNARDDELAARGGRRYRILSVIGKGGFGTVYRARLEGVDGFSKDVAIKLLSEDDSFPKDVLQRFRDEARILGLVRDRAIVSVDPPTKLGGRWAVVMEFVDGASCGRLLRLGTFPPSIALELVEEVSRALHKIYRHPGADGRPLKLLHRDLKPANLQITPSGEVKVLDFGIARADFAAREANTTINIGGTLGYIAPERLHGQEGPEGDIFSLGVVLHKLVMNANPPEDDGYRSGDPLEDPADPIEMVLYLSRQMRAPKPQDRPTARDLQRVARLMRDRIDGELLRDWAERVVPSASNLAADALVGEVIAETLANVAPLGVPPPPATMEQVVAQSAQRALWTGVGIGLAIFLVAVTAAVLVIGQQTKWGPSDPALREPSVVISDGVVVIEAAPPPDTDLVVAPEPSPPRPAPATVSPTPVTTNATTTAAVSPNAEGPIDAVLDVNPAGPTPVSYAVTFSSVPLGASVYVNEQLLGVTPLLKAQLPEGRHRVRLVSDGVTIEREIEVGRLLASRYVWRIKEDAWEAAQ